MWRFNKKGSNKRFVSRLDSSVALVKAVALEKAALIQEKLRLTTQIGRDLAAQIRDLEYWVNRSGQKFCDRELLKQSFNLKSKI